MNKAQQLAEKAVQQRKSIAPGQVKRAISWCEYAASKGEHFILLESCDLNEFSIALLEAEGFKVVESHTGGYKVIFN